jgi:hypothetical protein
LHRVWGVEMARVQLCACVHRHLCWFKRSRQARGANYDGGGSFSSGQAAPSRRHLPPGLGILVLLFIFLALKHMDSMEDDSDAEINGFHQVIGRLRRVTRFSL